MSTPDIDRIRERWSGGGPLGRSGAEIQVLLAAVDERDKRIAELVAASLATVAYIDNALAQVAEIENLCEKHIQLGYPGDVASRVLTIVRGDS